MVVLGLIVGPDRPAQGLIVLGYFAGLLALCTLAWLTGTSPLPLFGVMVPGFFQPGVFWAVISSPTIFLLLFLNRAVRTVGPLVLVFAFVAMLGGHLAIASLAFEPVFDLAAELAVLSGIHGGVLFWVIIGIGTLAGLWPAWRVVTMLRDRYAAKRSSDLLMTTNAIWLIQALSLAQTFHYEKGGLAALAAIVPFLGWRLTLHAGLRPVVAAAHARTPRRLLLLRVFGFGRRSRRLLDLLGTRWRLIGSIDLIAAPDLAARTVEPSTFMEFVRGRLGRLFIRTPEDLEQRLAAIDREPDPDGRYRINQLFCSDSMWQAAVTRLMGAASLVVMDLRGFGPHRRGSVFELQTLLDIVPVDRLIFLFDKTTDRAALETLLAERWQKLDAGSPNLAADECDAAAARGPRQRAGGGATSAGDRRGAAARSIRRSDADVTRRHAATVPGSRNGTRSRSCGATCSMNSRIERARFSRVAQSLPVDQQQRPEAAGGLVERPELAGDRVRIAQDSRCRPRRAGRR